jgi:hypothetical protein
MVRASHRWRTDDLAAALGVAAALAVGLLLWAVLIVLVVAWLG